MVARNPSPGRKRGWVGLVERDGKPVPYEEKGFYHLGVLKKHVIANQLWHPPAFGNVGELPRRWASRNDV